VRVHTLLAELKVQAAQDKRRKRKAQHRWSAARAVRNSRMNRNGYGIELAWAIAVIAERRAGRRSAHDPTDVAILNMNRRSADIISAQRSLVFHGQEKFGD